MQISALRASADFGAQVQRAAERLVAERVYERILARDHTVWRPDPTEIANRLGWLDSPHVMRDAIDPIRQFIDAVRADGYTHALLLGMGGSSLAPEVFRAIFGVADGFLDLSVLDSTQPDTVLAKERTLDLTRTLFLPATKSGGTVETLSLLKYFYNRTADAVGPDEAGRHFAAITDPGSGLEALAQHLGFRHIFRNDPNIGGRYSALSYYGLVAAGAIGADLGRLLDRANQALADPQPGIQLGAFLGAGALAGRDKLTLITSPATSAAGAWIEQLIAESTGKDGKGLLPVDLEPECAAHTYGPDRLFIQLRLDDAADTHALRLSSGLRRAQSSRRSQAIAAAGHPVLCLQLADAYDLGAAFFHWEIATAIVGFFLDIHPFDQPDVEAAKELARQMVAAYQQRGALPASVPDLVDGLALYGPVQGTTLPQALAHFLASGELGRAYIALQAHLPPTPATTNALQDLRRQLLARTGLATTLGFGPRFLHSTGQLHKGDAGRGLFIQLTADSAEDAPIPDEAGTSASSITFGVLAQAQALGDHQALVDQGRAVLRIHLGADIAAGIAQLRHAPRPEQRPYRRSPMSRADIGLIGLAVMGENLVLNMASHGFTVAVYNRTTAKVDAFMAGRARGKSIIGTHSPAELLAQLKKPRRVMLMVQAGQAVDRVIAELVPLLDQGDILIDGGNSNYQDTARRTQELAAKGLLYVGTGVSGGEEGALKGPSIMPGGNPAAWPHIKALFQAIAAKVADGSPCCDWVGRDGAGHYVKMVHNGIEYGDMQMIAEAYALMREGLGIEPPAQSEIFKRWNEGELDSYLIEITGDILAKTDDETGQPMVDVILDTAGQKGTGKWTGIDALQLGAPVTAITEAVFSRALSFLKDERVAAAEVLQGPDASFTGDKDAFVEDIRQALYAAKICSYAQGYQLLALAAREYGWELNYGGIALLWRGGCIIRAQFLGRIKEAFDSDPTLANLLLAPYFSAAIAQTQASWRRVVATAATLGIPVPTFASALAYYDGYRSARLPANLLQAQRDYFGAHTYERTDKPRGMFFHTNWTGHGGTTASTAYNV